MSQQKFAAAHFPCTGANINRADCSIRKASYIEHPKLLIRRRRLVSIGTPSFRRQLRGLLREDLARIHIDMNRPELTFLLNISFASLAD
jgi:hypothetical protein